ncbi:Ig-like domain-containing protein [Bacteroidota bacterium]
MKNSIRIGLLFLVMMYGFSVAIASDLIEITPITNKIILVVFDDGTVQYPNDLHVDRLDITIATDPASYSIASQDDDDFSQQLNPVDIGRKTKGTEFVKDAPWGGNSYDPRSKPWASKHFIYLFLDRELKSGNTYTLNTSALAANGSEWTFSFDEKELRSESIHVNTVGYETNAPKYGYVYQWMGDMGGLDLTAYNGASFQLYKDGVNEAVYTGFLKKRKSATNAETGQQSDTPDRNFLGGEVYECDFSGVTEDGIYTLVVEDMGCSYPFNIGTDALWDAYYTVGRSLYYQRSGIRLEPPYTDGDYIRPVNQNTKVTSDDGTDFSGLLLYCTYPYVLWDQGEEGGSSIEMIRDSAIGNTLDVAGWYHDAGDWDGYFSHQRIPILLMTTWEYFPERFADGDLNLPESGNGIPDLLDEASWLIKFNYRLRKELMTKGYSDGGVGGARVAPDFFTEVDGNAQSNKPSWQDHRRYVVSSADAYMTYLYAGQAAQFALILNKLGKDYTKFPVEMLDHVDFESMSRDSVNWEEEARSAYAWASAPENQPEKHAHYSAALSVYKMYAAVNLWRLTNEEQFHADAQPELEKLKGVSNLDDDERYGVYSYLLADNFSKDGLLHTALFESAVNTAHYRGVDAADIRACRWGGVFTMPMLVGQATTPWVFENMMAYGLTGEKLYDDVVHTTADYFLGTNPLHTTWATGLGPRPAEAGFHLDTRYNNNWVNYPGFIPYGPWSMSYGYTPYSWTIDGVEYEGGHGPWNKDWANFSMYPLMDEWPGHERWNSNIHAPMSTENTVHQNSVYGTLTYGYVNNRKNTNAGAFSRVASMSIDKVSLMLTAQDECDTLQISVDNDLASFSAIHWKSSDKRIAHVDQLGRVTGVTPGTCSITCSTLDGSVSVSCEVTCSWDQTAVDSIRIEPDTVRLIEGQSALLEVFFWPAEATNTFLDWSYTVEGIADIDDNGRLEALSAGTTLAIATSLNSSKKDTCFITVSEAKDFIIADFDAVIPSLSSPQPNVPQLYTPGTGTEDINAMNPMISAANESARVVKFNRGEGLWQLIGMVMPTADIQSTDAYAQLQFKYYGKEVEEFFIQVASMVGDNNYEATVAIEGMDAWKLFAMNIDVSFDIKQFNIFVNAKSGSAITCYFDDFTLAAAPAIWYEGLSLSDAILELDAGEEYILVAESDGNPISWLSADPTVASVDQTGKVNAHSRGSVRIFAVPLFGDPRECEVVVDGGALIPASEISLDLSDRLMLEKGETYQLTASITPDDHQDTIIWTSSDPGIVAISENGLITANAAGLATISASSILDTLIRVSLEVEVAVNVSSLKIDGDDAYMLQIDSTVQLIANISPEDASDKSIEWSSDKTDIARVSEEGLVTAVSDGTAIISAISVSNPDASDSVTVIVSSIGIYEEKGIFTVYPNPVDSYVKIIGQGVIESVKIVSITGKVFIQIPGLGRTEIEMYDLNLRGGIYIVEVFTANGEIIVGKLLVE